MTRIWRYDGIFNPGGFMSGEDQEPKIPYTIDGIEQCPVSFEEMGKILEGLISDENNGYRDNRQYCWDMIELTKWLSRNNRN
jgi:hypothetical protein